MSANTQAPSPGSVADGRAREVSRTEGRPAVRPMLVAHFCRVGRRRRLRAVDSAGAATYQAAAALSHQNRRRATEGLRDQLAIMARAAGLTPDWSTLAVTGPTEMTGTQHGARFEWMGRVAMHGSSPLVALPDPDAFLHHSAATDATVPFPVDTSRNRPDGAERCGSAQPPQRRSPSEITTRAAA